jgi:hypothetical protein
MRDWLDRCARNHVRQCQLDGQADQRAYERGHSDTDPIRIFGVQGSTTRTPNE